MKNFNNPAPGLSFPSPPSHKVGITVPDFTERSITIRDRKYENPSAFPLERNRVLTVTPLGIKFSRVVPPLETFPHPSLSSFVEAVRSREEEGREGEKGKEEE